VTALTTAGFWPRLAAHVVDCAVGVLVWLLCSMWLVIGLWALDHPPSDVRDAALILLAVLGLAAALHIAYHVVLVGGCGQTLGKMALGIAVVRLDGSLPGYGRALLRCFGGFLSWAAFGLGYVGILFGEERRGLADWLAGTRVVEELPGAMVPRPAPPAGTPLLGI